MNKNSRPHGSQEQVQNRGWVSPVEAARRLGVGLFYLYPLLWTGKLVGEKVNGRWRIPVAVVEQRLRAREARNNG